MWWGGKGEFFLVDPFPAWPSFLIGIIHLPSFLALPQTVAPAVGIYVVICIMLFFELGQLVLL